MTAAKNAEAERRLTDEEIDARRLMRAADPVPGYQKLVAVLCRRHHITIETRDTMPPGVAAFSVWRSRTIVIPPISTASAFAVALHEIAHVLAGACPLTEPHRRNPAVTNWHHCLECERQAWEGARRLVWFLPVMFKRLQQSLNVYRRTTPASPAVRMAAAHAVDFTAAYAIPMQRRVENELKQQRVEESLRPQAVRVDEEIARQRRIVARQRATHRTGR
jgi:hypothetical protein